MAQLLQSPGIGDLLNLVGQRLDQQLLARLNRFTAQAKTGIGDHASAAGQINLEPGPGEGFDLQIALLVDLIHRRIDDKPLLRKGSQAVAHLIQAFEGEIDQNVLRGRRGGTGGRLYQRWQYWLTKGVPVDPYCLLHRGDHLQCRA